MLDSGRLLISGSRRRSRFFIARERSEMGRRLVPSPERKVGGLAGFDEGDDDCRLLDA